MTPNQFDNLHRSVCFSFNTCWCQWNFAQSDIYSQRFDPAEPTLLTPVCFSDRICSIYYISNTPYVSINPTVIIS